MDVSLEVSPKIDLDVVHKAHQILHKPDQQVELRVLLKEGRAMSGRFDDEAKMLEWLKHADDPSVALVWWSVQQLIPEAATNDLQHRKASTNGSVAIRNWIIVDIDPDRDRDPASDTELRLASIKTNEVLDWLKTNGIRPLLVILSGNGYHLYIPTDNWPNDEEHNRLAKAFLEMLSAKFSDDEVKIDSATANPGRLGKVPGCISRKGEEEEDRVHRMVKIEIARPDAPLLPAQAVRNLIEAEGYSNEHVKPEQKKRKGLHPNFDPYDVIEHGESTVEYEFERNGAAFYCCNPCLYSGTQHRGDCRKSCLIVYDNGSVGYECFSDDCEGIGFTNILKKWREEGNPYTGPIWLEPQDAFTVEDIATEDESEAAEPVPVSASSNISAAYTLDDTEEEAGEFECESNPKHLSDIGNGARLAKLFGTNIRNVVEADAWFVWTGKRWKQDKTYRIFKMAKKAVMEIAKEANLAADPQTAEKIFRWYAMSQSKAKLEAMVWSAKSEGKISVSANTLDSDGFVVNLGNGTLNLRTMTFRKHRRTDLLTKQIPYSLDAAAECPMWLKFMDEIMQGDAEKIDFLQRWFGYCLTGDVGEQCFVVFWGEGSNGKSTLVDVITRILGTYTLHAEFDTFTTKGSNKSIRDDLAALKGVRLVAASEPENLVRLSEGVVKNLTGGEPIRARLLYENAIEFEPTHKIILSTNHKPRIGDNSDGMWRRVRLVPFKAKFSDELGNKDRNLKDKLLKEAPGILNWIVDGYRKFKESGLPIPKDVEDATAAYRQEQDILAMYIEDECETGAELVARRSAAYKAYCHWCEENGEKPMRAKTFLAAMEERGFKPTSKKLDGKAERVYVGLRLRVEEADSFEEIEDAA